jgi:hypothetical protein
MARARMGGVRLIALSGQAIAAPAMLVWNPDLVAPALAKFVATATRVIGSQ